jgi:hypothetical protein
MNHKRASKKFTKDVLIVDGFAAGEIDTDLAKRMMEKLRRDNRWPDSKDNGESKEHWPIEEDGKGSGDIVRKEHHQWLN